MNNKLLLTLLLFACIALPVTADESIEKMENVTVKGDSGSVKLTHSPMPVSVIDMERFQGRDITLNEVLKRVAGVKVRSEGGMGSKSTIAIQGLEGKRVKIFIDGNPLNSPDGTFGINDIPIQFIERIEIYKGVVPAKFGGDALGGAVNVVTRDYIGDYIDTTVATSSYGTYRGAAVFKKDFMDHKYELGVGGFLNQSANDYAMKSPYVEGLNIKRDHDFYRSVLGAFVVKINDTWFDEIAIELVRYESEKEIQGIKSLILQAESNSEVNIAAFSFLKEKFIWDRLELDYDVVFVDLSLHLIDNAETCYNWNGSTRTCPGVGGEMDGLPNNSDNKQIDYRHDLNLHYIMTDNYGLNFHLNSQFSDYEPYDALASSSLGYEIGAFPSSRENTVISLSLESSHFKDILANDMGLKYYKYEHEITSQVRGLTSVPAQAKTSGSQFGFYESIRYEPVKNLFLKASYEHAYRLPNTDELFGDGITITSAPGLEPEEANNFNIGVLFDRYDFFGMPWVKAEVNYFHRNVTNLIKLEPAVHTSGYVNLGETRVSGFETELQADITPNWYVYGNYTWQELTDEMEFLPSTNGITNPTYGHTIPNVPKLYGNLGVEYKMLGILRKDSLLKLFWELNWTDKYYYGWELSRFQNRKIDEQTIHTAGLEYSFMDDKCIAGFEVRNLTNEEVTDVFNSPLQGRTFHFNFRYTWSEN